ncbi:MAG TPA: hypothetical protein VHN37_06540 [Actinomycetota bacterium]|nr:hypothetical protein [Actinomycetota bacterium]
MSRFHPPSIFEILATRGVDYVLIGAMAAIVHGAGLTATADVDIAPAPDEENRGRLATALRDMDARLRVGGTEDPIAIALDERTFKGISIMTFVTKYGPFDVLFEPAGAPSYAELYARGTTTSLSGVDVRVAAIEDVIAMKRAAGRRKDAAHVVTLLEYLRGRDRPG